MLIRSANFSDIPQIIDLGKELWESHLAFDPSYYQLENNFSELFYRWAETQINQPNQFIFVASETSQQKIVGFISGFLKELYPWFKLKYVGHISFLVVESKYRRRGVGRLLENEAVKWFKKKNISYIEVYTDELNQAGVSAWFSYQYLPFKKFLRKKI